METHTYSENEIIYLPVKRILPNPYQPRRIHNKQSLTELAESIKQYGLIQPIAVRYINNKIYELVNGERRLKATKLAGLETIPAVVIYANDREAASISLAENIQRENLNYLEEAESMRILKYGFKYSVEDISHIINKSCSYIEDNLKFLKFSNEIKNLLYSNDITRYQALLLLNIDDEDVQKRLILHIAKYHLNDSEVEYLINSEIRQNKIKTSTQLNNIKSRVDFRSLRLFTGSIRQALSMIKSEGMETSYEISRNDDDYEIKILIKA